MTYHPNLIVLDDHLINKLEESLVLGNRGLFSRYAILGHGMSSVGSRAQNPPVSKDICGARSFLIGSNSKVLSAKAAYVRKMGLLILSVSLPHIISSLPVLRPITRI